MASAPEETLAFRMVLKPGQAEAYRRRHDDIPADLLALLRDAASATIRSISTRNEPPLRHPEATGRSRHGRPAAARGDEALVGDDGRHHGHQPGRLARGHAPRTHVPDGLSARIARPVTSPSSISARPTPRWCCTISPNGAIWRSARPPTRYGVTALSALRPRPSLRLRRRVAREVAEGYPLDAIAITTHGASIVLVDDDGLTLPMIDYEFDIAGPESDAYDAVRPAFSETLSPPMGKASMSGGSSSGCKSAFPMPLRGRGGSSPTRNTGHGA